jgi:predicted methyltransferase
MTRINLSKKEIDKMPIELKIPLYYLKNRRIATNIFITLNKGYDILTLSKKNRLSKHNLFIVLNDLERIGIISTLGSKINLSSNIRLTEIGNKLLEFIELNSNYQNIGINKKYYNIVGEVI